MKTPTLLVSSCSYKYDTVSFGAVGKMPVAKTPVPKVEIDTNMNSTSEGVVKNTGRILQARFPGVISRDESFTLLINGRFTKHDNTTIPS